MAAAKRIKEGAAEVDLLGRIASDEAFGMTQGDLDALVEPARFVGRAPQQVVRFLDDHVAPMLAKQSRRAVPLSDPDVHV
jgi:adenylosuccinate lyase